jgi:hypothetical protein
VAFAPEDVSVELDPLGAIIFMRYKINKGEAPPATQMITESEAKKMKIPLIKTPALKLG